MAQLKFNSILVVYYGNVCRSPIGERLLRKRLPGVKVKWQVFIVGKNALQMQQRQIYRSSHLLKDMPT
ncbi:hypothetical protein ACLK1S_06150 [Escherichia coli]